MTVRVAVIEDDIDISARICRYVEIACPGAFIEQYRDKQSAIEASRRRVPYNLVTLDIRLGDQEDAGMTILLEFFAAQRVPILAITGEAQFIPALRAQCARVLRKPVLEEDVVDAVRDLLKPASFLGREPHGKGRLTWKGNVLGLTPSETRLVELLSQRTGVTIAYSELKRLLGIAATETLHTHRSTATRKFRAWDAQFAAIKNIHGEGYQWDEGSRE